MAKKILKIQDRNIGIKDLRHLLTLSYVTRDSKVGIRKEIKRRTKK